MLEVMHAHADRPVIIGAGLAGLTAALHLAPEPVLVLARSPLGAPAPAGGEASSGADALIGADAASGWAQGGIAAALAPDDSPALHAADTFAAGDGLCEPEIVTRITAAAPAAVEALERLGVTFARDAQGRIALGLEAAHGRRRIAHAGGDASGREIMRAVTRSASRTPSITVIGLEARRLAVRDGAVVGVVAAGPSGAVLVPTRRVVLATGGAGALYRRTTNPLGAIGSGLALAARAGAALADMEFVQFHPTALDCGLDPMPLVSEAVRGEGAVLIDETGLRFMEGQGPAELSPRDVVARAVSRHMALGHRVFLDARAALGPRFPARFPGIAAACRAAGIDPSTMPIPVGPAAHYHMGGVAVDGSGRASVEGLWACGEAASTGLHGANRLASNSLLEAVVQARLAAESVAGHEAASAPRHASLVVPPAPDANGLRELMSRHLGVVRERAGLLAAIEALRPLAAGLGAAADPALIGLFIAVAALSRRESRGAHHRSDYPRPAPGEPRRSRLDLRGVEALADEVTGDTPALAQGA